MHADFVAMHGLVPSIHAPKIARKEPVDGRDAGVARPCPDEEFSGVMDRR
jgi:hypothetical protein